MTPRVSNIEVSEAFSETCAHVGRRIRDRRTYEGLSQQKLADMVGMNVPEDEGGSDAARNIERGCGNASLRTLVKLAAGLNVTVADFFGNGAFHNYEYGTVDLHPGGSEPYQ